MKRDLYADVTARILAELEKGAVPWIKPWRSTPGMGSPAQRSDRTSLLRLQCHPALDRRRHGLADATLHFTFQQALNLGGNVRKGEKGTKVYFVKHMNRKDENAPDGEEGEQRSFTMLREYTVFNVAQCDGLPNKVLNPATKPPINADERAAEELVAELCAAFLCAEFSLNNDLRHAGYINTWIAMLKADSRAFMTAASKAQAAADHLRNLAIAEPVKEAA